MSLRTHGNVERTSRAQSVIRESIERIEARWKMIGHNCRGHQKMQSLRRIHWCTADIHWYTIHTDDHLCTSTTHFAFANMHTVYRYGRMQRQIDTARHPCMQIHASIVTHVRHKHAQTQYNTPYTLHVLLILNVYTLRQDDKTGIIRMDAHTRFPYSTIHNILQLSFLRMGNSFRRVGARVSYLL